MVSRAALRACSWVAALASGLCACGVVDRNSPRIVRYNVEAESAQQQALLLNIVRASMRRPMQFTTVTNLDGDASSKVSTSWGIPFGTYTGSANMLTVNAPDYTENASVKVATLDDSSYYKGLLSPIKPQLFDLYVHSGYPPEVLVNLFVRQIIIQRIAPPCGVQRHIKGCEFTFTNFPGLNRDIDLFQRMVSYLLRLGLTTEHIEKPGTKGKKKGEDNAEPENDYALCFRPGSPYDESMARSSLCSSSTAGKRTLSGATSTLVVELEPRVVEHLKRIARMEGRGDLADELAFFAGQKVALTVYTRSIQNIIYFLGELVRRHINPEFDNARITRVLAVPRHSDEGAFRDAHECKETPPVYPCKYLFEVRQGLELSSPALSVSYEGQQYTIVDERSTGNSTQVFDLAKQLFATNIKSDQLPRTTTISVIGR